MSNNCHNARPRSSKGEKYQALIGDLSLFSGTGQGLRAFVFFPAASGLFDFIFSGEHVLWNTAFSMVLTFVRRLAASLRTEHV